jgi:hypothetical protein
MTVFKHDIECLKAGRLLTGEAMERVYDYGLRWIKPG